MDANYLVGEWVKLSCLTIDADTKAPVDPDDLTLIIQSPSDALATINMNDMIKAGVGQYQHKVELTEAGKWACRWVGSGQHAGAMECVFNVAKSAIKETSNE